MISDTALKGILRSDRLVALLGDLIRATLGGVVLIAVVSWVLYYGRIARFMVAHLAMNDFGRFYYSARLFLDGHDMYGASPATFAVLAPNVTHPFWNMNPPHFHLPLLVLAMLSPGQALAAWALASLASLGGSLFLIAKEIEIRINVVRALWGLLALLAFAGTGTLIVTGQVSLLLLGPVTLAWLAARRGNWTRAGVWLGLAMSIKPFLLIFVPYLLVRRRFVAAVTALLAVAGAFALGLAVFGPAAHLAWLRALESTDWTWAAMNGSFLGVLSRTLSESPYFTPLVSAPGLVRPLWLCAAFAAGVLTLLAARWGETPEAVDRGFVLVLVGAQLVSPLGWIYYFWLPIGPAVSLLANWIRRRPERASSSGTNLTTTRCRDLVLWASLPGLIWPLSLVTWHQPSPWATVTVGSAYFWATLLVWTGVLVDAFGSRADRPRPPHLTNTRPGL